ncbi:MAG TPA: uroporphyrinogen-III synthase [Propionibacteriaceae bacterium]|nr:uroporphyrinogen-III synthase [Propionibacteriaceae bacterium]
MTVADSTVAQSVGRVSFVGVGPGDPSLMTLAAVQAISDADIILLDHEALRPLLDHHAVKVGRHAIIASFGDSSDTPIAPVTSRVAAVIRAAEEAHSVVRLVLGDPFMDGGAAQEVAACGQAGLDIEIIPGVSSLTAIPEYAGVALQAGDVQLVSALDGRFGREGEVAWSPTATLVVNTRAGHVDRFIDHAVASGRASDEPVLVTLNGGSTRQSSQSCTLAGLSTMIMAQQVGSETQMHIMLGRAVGERSDLDWFESKSLFGWRVLVPRTKDQAWSLNARLHSYGAHVEEVPTIAVEPPRSPQQMDKAIRGLVEGRFEWVVFTSMNAVRAVSEKFDEYGLDARAFAGLRVAAVGNTTAAALKSWGIVPDLVPVGEHSAAGLAAEFPAYDDVLDPINRVFLPRADIATEVLISGLTELGWEVEDVTAYRTVRAAPPPAETREAIKTGKFDAVVFASSSTVRNLVGIAGKPHASSIIAAIGPQTAETCREHGLRVDVVAPEPSAIVLVDALAAFAQQRRTEMLARGDVVTRPSERKRRRRSLTNQA